MAIIKFKINKEEHYIEWWWIQNDTTGTTDVIEKIRSGTKAEYDLLWTYDPDTYYIITDEWEWREYIISNTTGTTQKITNIRKWTQAEYDLLGTYDSRCYYIISDRAEPIVNNTWWTTLSVSSIRYGTMQEFQAIVTKDADCLYFVENPKAPTELQAVVNTDTVTLTWEDPADDWTSIWQNTKIVRKAGSEPTSISDWTLVVTETTRNQYQTTWYDDTGLTAWTYFYKAFATFSRWQELWSSAVEVEIL